MRDSSYRQMSHSICKKMNRESFIITYSFSLVLIFLFSGCRDNQINPYETDTGIYSIYGAINLHETEHVIRVRDLNTFHQDSNSINLDAVVTFYDLENGTSQSLSDSVVQFPANYTHNFILEKDFVPRTPYRVTVERSDGLSVSSDFTTPGITETHIVPSFGPYSCFTELQLVFQNVLPDEQIRWEIGFRYNEETYWKELTNHCPQTYDQKKSQLIISMDTRGFLNTIFPKPMENGLCRFKSDPEITCMDLDSDVVQIRYLHLGPEWNLVFPARHPDPVAVGSIQNGLGFLGAYRQDAFSYSVRLE